jgi:YHS domain-containing protein
MFKIIIVFASMFLLYKLISGEKKHNLKEEVIEKVKAGEMVKDPICGTYVSVNSDIRVRDGDKILCFCSYECRDKYLKMIENKKNK